MESKLNAKLFLTKMHTKVILPPDHGVADAFDKSYTRLDAMQVDIEAFLLLLPKDAQYSIYGNNSLFIDWNAGDAELESLSKALASLLNSSAMLLTNTDAYPKAVVYMVIANDWTIFIRRLEPLSV